MELSHTITFQEGTSRNNRTEIEVVIKYEDHDIESVEELRETVYEDGAMVSNKLLDVKAWDSLGIIDKLIFGVNWDEKYADAKSESDYLFNSKYEL